MYPTLLKDLLHVAAKQNSWNFDIWWCWILAYMAIKLNSDDILLLPSGQKKANDIDIT